MLVNLAATTSRSQCGFIVIIDWWNGYTRDTALSVCSPSHKLWNSDCFISHNLLVAVQKAQPFNSVSHLWYKMKTKKYLEFFATSNIRLIDKSVEIQTMLLLWCLSVRTPSFGLCRLVSKVSSGSYIRHYYLNMRRIFNLQTKDVCFRKFKNSSSSSSPLHPKRTRREL